MAVMLGMAVLRRERQHHTCCPSVPFFDIPLIREIAEVRFRNPYQTWHSFASDLLMLGANPLYVASQLGHADTTLVMRTYGK